MKNKKMLRTILMLAAVSSLVVGCGKGSDKTKSDEVSQIEVPQIDPLDSLKDEIKDLKVEIMSLTETIDEGFKDLQKTQNDALVKAQEEAKDESKVVEKPQLKVDANPLAILPGEEKFDLQEVLNIKSAVFANSIATDSKNIEAFKETIIPEIANEEEFEAIIKGAFEADEAKFKLEQIKVVSLEGDKAEVVVIQSTEFSTDEKSDNETTATWKLEKHDDFWKIGEIETLDMNFKE